MRLLAITPETLLALADGIAPDGTRLPPGGLETAEVLAMLARAHAPIHAAEGWGMWLAIVGGEIVGSAAIKARPSAGSVEIGYGIAAARRGRGHGRALVRAVVAALEARGLTEVRAHTARHNIASARCLAAAGFRDAGPGPGQDERAWSRALAGPGASNGADVARPGR